MSIKFVSRLSLVAITAAIALSGVASSASAGSPFGAIGGFARGMLEMIPGGGFIADLAEENANPFQAAQPTAPMAPGGMQLGNRCATPVGVSGPGPVNPLGSPCWMGPYQGIVIR